MPTISEFYGISIRMYYRNEHPLPHFHVFYAGDEASVSIDGSALVAGALPVRAHRLVREWAALHRSELAANWGLARAKLPLLQIEPLS